MENKMEHNKTRQPGYYWAKIDGRKIIVELMLGYDGWYSTTNNRVFKEIEFDWIDSSPIPEPKPQLIPGKYYIVKSKEKSDKFIAKCVRDLNPPLSLQNPERIMFQFSGCLKLYSSKWYEVLSEGFTAEEIEEKLK
jgi:hypothetical protein